jgi:hypothetical protein
MAQIISWGRPEYGLERGLRVGEDCRRSLRLPPYLRPFRSLLLFCTRWPSGQPRILFLVRPVTFGR